MCDTEDAPGLSYQSCSTEKLRAYHLAPLAAWFKTCLRFVVVIDPPGSLESPRAFKIANALLLLLFLLLLVCVVQDFSWCRRRGKRTAANWRVSPEAEPH